MGLLPIVLPAALFLVLELLWCRPSWLHRGAGRGLGGGRRDDADPAGPRHDPFALPFVRHQLGVLAAELDRLEHDDQIFAKAFRTFAAQAAYEALLAEAARLTALSTMEVEFVASVAPLREELEV